MTTYERGILEVCLLSVRMSIVDNGNTRCNILTHNCRLERERERERDREKDRERMREKVREGKS